MRVDADRSSTRPCPIAARTLGPGPLLPPASRNRLIGRDSPAFADSLTLRTTRSTIMAHVAKIPVAEARGELKAIYEAALQRTDRVFQILQVQSLSPRSLRAGLQLYQATTTSRQSPVPRWVREAIATVVSQANACHY